MRERDEWIHNCLDEKDFDEEGRPAEPADSERLASYREVLLLLESARERAPDGFAGRVMAALPREPERGWIAHLRGLWPAHGLWVPPAVAGALAGLILAIGVPQYWNRKSSDLVPVTFEVHAPEAHRVEVVGNFNEWKPGDLVLTGPDATGDWKATVKLPSGRYEYMFLVDGKDCLPDPDAPRRPDGFGRENALLQV